MSDNVWDLINQLITFRHKRYTSVEQIQHHPWFADFNAKLASQTTSNKLGMRLNRKPVAGGEPKKPANPWSSLRTQTVIQPPFVPQLESPTDHHHFDDFSDPEAMKIYKEVYEKQD